MAVYIFFAEGFEEVEALIPSDFLVRAGIEVRHVGVGDGTVDSVKSSHCVEVLTPYSVSDVKLEDAQALIFPGGLPGAENLARSEQVISLISRQLNTRNVVGAICAAPAYVLGTHGFLDGKKFTGYPGTEERAPRATYIPDMPVVRDENIITSQGVGTAGLFAYTLVAILAGEDIADKVWNSTLSHYTPKELISDIL